MKKYQRLFSVLMIITLLFPSIQSPIKAAEGDEENERDIPDMTLGDWSFDVFGSNTGDDKNPDPIIHDDGSVTLEASGGKISSSVDGISFYNQEIPADTNFEISTTATVHHFGANNQVSFGLMLRDELGDHRQSDGHESNYVAVGALDQSLKGFYKQDSQTKLDAFASVIPSAEDVYDLKIKKSGDTYVVSVDGNESDPITLDHIFSENLSLGAYVARDTEVTFSDLEINVDERTVESLHVDSEQMKTEYLKGEDLDLSDLEVTAEFSDGSSESVSEDDYIVTGFDSSDVGSHVITVHYNGQTADIEIDIVDLTVTQLDIKYYPAKQQYYQGDVFDPQGLVVIATYNDGYQTEELTQDQYDFVIDGDIVDPDAFVFEKAGEIPVTISSTNNPDETTTFNVDVRDTEITDLDIRSKPEKTTYFIDDALDLAGLSVYAVYGEDEVKLTQDDYTISGFDSSSTGDQTITVSHKNETATFTVTVKEKEVEAIEVTEYPKTTYQIGDDFEEEGLVVSKVYDNGEQEAYTAYNVDASAFDSTEPGTYDIGIEPEDDSLDPITFKVTVRDAVEAEWHEISFGQSTSIEKNYIETLDDDTIRIVAEKGAGKITGDHDGIAFYYTEIDAEKDNFELSADIYVKDYAKSPDHDGQESFGIMARDAIGTNGDASVFASNIAAIGGFSGGTNDPNGTQLFVRTGILSSDGEGSQGIQKKMLKEEKPTADNTATDYRLTLAKTNSGFTGTLNDGEEEMIFEPEILNVQDDKMYVGFYAARLADIEVSNIDLKVTDAATDPPKETPPAEPKTPNLDIVSLEKTSTTDYDLKARVNVDGTLSVKQNGETIAQDEFVESGEILDIPAELKAESDTHFSIVFLPDDTQYLTNYDQIVQNFTVTMKTFAEDGDIYVAPDGTHDGKGTEAEPLDLDTAIDFVQAGQKIIVQEGHYVRDSKLEIKKYNDGEEDAMKYLVADSDADTRPVIDFDKKSEGVVHSGDYWHVSGIDMTQSAGNTKGFTIGGSYNVIDHVRTYANGDTGLQISRTSSDADEKSQWPAHNIVQNSISFDNIDPSENNADGFAAKLTVGDGNIFRGNISHNNIDDGWDLYTKKGTGAIGAVTIENNISFNNGTLTNGYEGNSGQNGFKLGGEGIHVPHVLENNLSFGNGANGFTNNSNPGIVSERNMSINNDKNLSFTTYTDIEPDFTIDGFVSIQTEGTEKDDYPAELDSDRNYMFDGETSKNGLGEAVSTDIEEELIDYLELDDLFNYDQEGYILSIDEKQWERIWLAYDETVDSDSDGDIDLSELESLIKDAKSKTNKDGTYTKASYNSLQEAITSAEKSLNTIDSEAALQTEVERLQAALNGLVEVDKTEDKVVSVPHIEGNVATVSTEDIDMLAQNGQLVIDLAEQVEVTEVYLTSDQLTALINKNAAVTVQKEDIEITIPVHYLDASQSVTITIDTITKSDVMIPKDKKLSGGIYDITIRQQDTIISDFSEEHPLTLAFKVDTSEVSDVENIHLYYLNEDRNKWEDIGGIYKEDVISVDVMHLSMFAPMETVSDDANDTPGNENDASGDDADEEGTDAENSPSDNEGNDGKDIENGTSPSKGDGEELPKTASPIFNQLLIGLVLISVGGIALYVVRRRKQNV